MTFIVPTTISVDEMIYIDTYKQQLLWIAV
jgi:hypothetical protein